MSKTPPTTIRLKEPIRTALRAYAESKVTTVSTVLEELVVDGLKRKGYLTASGRLGKAALIGDQDDN